MAQFREVTCYSTGKKFFINLDELLSIQTIEESENRFTLLTLAADLKKNISVNETAEEIFSNK